MNPTLPISHLDDQGKARMVDVSEKTATERSALACCKVRIGRELADQLRASPNTAKGNILETARLAGILAAKRTAELIPLCHPIALDHVHLEATLTENAVRLEATARAHARTGVEMEALTAVTVAALAVYDMIKSAAPHATIAEARVLRKQGGKTGLWTHPEENRHAQR